MFCLLCLKASHPLRWVPSCLEVWATATGTLFTSTTTTRWVSLLFTICSSDCLDSYYHILHSVSLVILWTLHFTCDFLTYLELFIIMVSEALEHFELRLGLGFVSGVMRGFACHHVIHTYSLHIFFILPHLLSFFSANYTLCEYECVSEGTYTSFVSFSLVSSLCLLVLVFHQTVNELWLLSVCFYLVVVLPICKLICFFLH